MRLTKTAILFAAVITAGTVRATNISITPTTTLSSETANNTSGADSFTTQTNNNPAPSNISKLPVRSLLYSGSSTKIYAHFMPWFGGANHMWVGYHSDDRVQVQKQVDDMMSRGYDGAIVDWYGADHARENNATLYMRDEAEKRGGLFSFAVMEDVGSLNACANTLGCDITQKMIDDLNYVAATYYPSPMYMRIGGRPVMFFFGVDKYVIDWPRARAGVNGNPLFIFRNSGAFTHAQSDGGFSWVGISTTASSMGLGYLDDFYSTALKYPTKQTFGSAYAGFNNTLAAWVSNPPKIVDRQCGQTWIASLNEAGTYYSAAKPLPQMQMVTWNDYEEGSELETGVDSCATLSATASGSALSWTLTGATSVVDHYNVLISLDGQNLMQLAQLPAAQGSLDLSTFSLGAGTYTLYVQAYGKPSLRNAMSNPATYTVVANQPPVVTLALDRTSGVAPQTVNATATAADLDGSVTSTSIDFGDGSASATTLTAAHQYTAPGTYTVTATATDNAGATASSTATVTIAANQPPVAALSLSPGSGIAPVTVTASTGNSTDADGSIASSSIDFGDGTVMPGPNASHAYTTTGTMTVTARVSDDKGATSSTTGTVSVAAPNRPPVAALSVTPASGTAPVTVTASTAASTDADGTIASSQIDFGDGTILSGPSASHVYSTTGTKTVTATVTDNSGATATASATVTVAAPNKPPVAALSVTPASGTAPVTVTASTAGSTDADGTIASSQIDFGDGTIVSGPSASHVYSTTGTKTVTATVTDNSGATATASATVVVSAPVATTPTVTITAPLTGATITGGVRVVASGKSSAVIYVTQLYADGVKKTEVAAASIDATLTLAVGLHKITVQCMDRAGNTFKSSVSITVANNQPPIAALSVTPTSGTAALLVSATTTASTDPDGSIASRLIDFGDGTSSTLVAATHTYKTAGTYTVRATVTDNKGASASASQVVTVKASSSVASSGGTGTKQGY